MDKRQLTDQQFSELVDFLYRWGLKSQELLSEMADHYSEKALDRMDMGYSWERVLKSFKTRETYLHLRKMQSNHEKLYNKQWWKYALKELWSVVSSPRSMFLVIATVVLLYFAFSNRFTGPLMPDVIALKALAMLGVAVYFGKFHKYTRHSMLLKSDRYFYLGLINFTFLHFFVTQYVIGSKGSRWEGVMQDSTAAWIWASLIGVSVVLDIVIIRFIWKAIRSSRTVYSEVFERLND